MNKLNRSGVYRWVVTRNDGPTKYYIGGAKKLISRSKGHLYDLRLGKHKNTDFQQDYDKYGLNSFKFEILLICSKEKSVIHFYEQLVLDSYDRELLYNICLDSVNSRLGCITPIETRLKQAAARTGTTHSEETRQKISSNKKGWIPPDSWRQKQSLVQKGKKSKPGQQDAAIAALRGRKLSEDELARRLATRRANAAARGYF